MLFSSEVKLPKQSSEIEYEILRLLSRQASLFPMELVQLSSKIKPGSVYVYLGRLKGKKWVRALPGETLAPSGKPMMRYSITGIGAARFTNHHDVNPWRL